MNLNFVVNELLSSIFLSLDGLVVTAMARFDVIKHVMSCCFGDRCVYFKFSSTAPFEQVPKVSYSWG